MPRAALREAAETADSPHQAKPASQLFPDFGDSGKRGGVLNDF